MSFVEQDAQMPGQEPERVSSGVYAAAMPSQRVPPQSEDTELAVLNAWIVSDKFAKAWKPEPELFASAPHKAFARSFSNMDPTVRDETAILTQLAQDGNSKASGGSAGLFRIRHNAPCYDDPWAHVEKLRSLAALRSLIAGLTTAVTTAYTTSDIDPTIASVQQALKTTTVRTGARILSVADMFAAFAQRVIDKHTKKARRCPSGVPSFDADTGGFRGPHVAVMGAGTSWGKSSFAIMVADETMSVGMRPLIVTFEDDEDLYGRRLLARRTKLNAAFLRDMKLTEDEDRILMDACKNAEHDPFFLDARGRAVESVASDIRSMCASEPIDLVICDYLQAAPSSRQTQDRRNEITHISRSLTDAIKSSNTDERKVAGLIFSQIKRLEPGEIPSKHSLKESGDVENSAEMVILGYQSKEGIPTMLVDKCKDGLRGGRYQLAWHPDACCFLGEAVKYDGAYR